MPDAITSHLPLCPCSFPGNGGEQQRAKRRRVEGGGSGSEEEEEAEEQEECTGALRQQLAVQPLLPSLVWIPSQPTLSVFGTAHP